MTNKDFSLFPSPCYIMEEGLLRKNLALIKSVADRAGVNIMDTILGGRVLPSPLKAPCVAISMHINSWEYPSIIR